MRNLKNTDFYITARLSLIWVWVWCYYFTSISTIFYNETKNAFQKRQSWRREVGMPRDQPRSQADRSGTVPSPHLRPPGSAQDNVALSRVLLTHSFEVECPGIHPHSLGSSAHAQIEGRLRVNVAFAFLSPALWGRCGCWQAAGQRILCGLSCVGRVQSCPDTDCSDPGGQPWLGASVPLHFLHLPKSLTEQMQPTMCRD